MLLGLNVQYVALINYCMIIFSPSTCAQVDCFQVNAPLNFADVYLALCLKWPGFVKLVAQMLRLLNWIVSVCCSCAAKPNVSWRFMERCFSDTPLLWVNGLARKWSSAIVVCRAQCTVWFTDTFLNACIPAQWLHYTRGNMRPAYAAAVPRHLDKPAVCSQGMARSSGLPVFMDNGKFLN